MTLLVFGIIVWGLAVFLTGVLVGKSLRDHRHPTTGDAYRDWLTVQIERGTMTVGYAMRQWDIYHTLKEKLATS